MKDFKDKVLKSLKIERKPARKVASDIIKEAIEDGGVLGPSDMAALFLYFEKGGPITRDKYNLLDLIIDEKSPQHALRYIYSDGEHLSASDGSIVAIIKQAAEKGFYKPKNYDLEKKELGLRYPGLDLILDPQGEKVVLKSFDFIFDDNMNLFLVFNCVRDARGYRIAIRKNHYDIAMEYERVSPLTESVVYAGEDGIDPYAPVIFRYSDGTTIAIAKTYTR